MSACNPAITSAAIVASSNAAASRRESGTALLVEGSKLRFYEDKKGNYQRIDLISSLEPNKKGVKIYNIEGESFQTRLSPSRLLNTLTNVQDGEVVNLDLLA